MNKYAAWFMILCSMTLMQWHGAHFWHEQTDDWMSGIGISFCLEVALLSLWYAGQHWFLWCAKWVAAFLLIAGTWYQITTPISRNIQIVTALHDKIEIVKDEVETLKVSLTTYEENSKKRLDWAGRIDKTRAELKASRSELKALIDNRATADPKWSSSSVPRLVAAALLIILTAQLMSVTSLRSRNGSTVMKTVTAKRNVTRNGVTVEQLPERYEETVKAVAEEIARQVEELGSQTKLCRKKGLRHEHIAAVLKHEEKKDAGEATITPKMLQKMVGVLEVAA